MILPQRPAPSPGMPALGRTHARIVWLAIALVFAGAQVAAYVAASSLDAAPSAALGDLFLAVGGVVVLADLGIGFFVASRIRKNASPDAPPDSVAATQVIVGAASAVSGGLVSAVFFFLTRHGLILVLAVPCALALLVWFPTDRRWAALRPAGAHGAPRPSAMMRE